MLSKIEIEKSLPAHLKTAATQELTDKINQISQDPEFAQQVGDNFISYTAVLKEGRFKTEDYLNAVVYVSHKLLGASNEEAYMKTFSQRYAALVAKNTSAKDIASYVSAYNRGKLVNLILEQTLVPTHVLNAHIYQKAINVQVDLMSDPDVSPKVRTDAANSLLTHLKKPENKAFDLKLEIEDSSGMRELKESINRLAEQQRAAIEQGNVTTKTLAETPLFEARIIHESGS